MGWEEGGEGFYGLEVRRWECNDVLCFYLWLCLRLSGKGGNGEWRKRREGKGRGGRGRGGRRKRREGKERGEKRIGEGRREEEGRQEKRRQERLHVYVRKGV